MTPRPWEVRASRQLLRDRWISVRAETVVDGRGHVLDPYYLLDYRDWAQVVAITAAEELVLVRLYRHAAGRVTLELPAGVIDDGEHPVAAAARELAEETGFVADSFRLVSSLSPNTATHTNLCHTVLALGARPGAAIAHEPGEDIEPLTLPISEVLAGLPNGMLPQAMHVAAVVCGLAAAGRLDLSARRPA